MDYLLNLLSAHVGIIGGADGPTAVVTSGSLPLPALTVAAFGIIFILYVYIAKAINAKKAPVAETTSQPAPVQAAAVQPVVAAPVLTGVEEKEAAVIMAIVSHKTGIPLNRLSFKSIKLTEDK